MSGREGCEHRACTSARGQDQRVPRAGQQECWPGLACGTGIAGGGRGEAVVVRRVGKKR